MDSPPFIDGRQVREAVSVAVAADALEACLHGGLDPEAEPQRDTLDVGPGHLLVMPAAVGPHATVKLVTVGGDPRIQGLAIVFDADTLAPVATIDAVALTELRTPAVSLVAARRMVRGPVDRVVIFGRGPQGVAHAAALREEFDPSALTLLHSSTPATKVATAVEEADLICCATTAREPLFDGDLVSDSAIVIAVGSHEPTVRELDASLVSRAAVVVESRRSAQREAGDLLMAGISRERLMTLAELLAGKNLPADRPRLFKSTGMSWEDTVIASSILRARGISGASDPSRG